MALVEVNFISKALKRTVTFNAIIPTDKFVADDPRKDPKDAIPYKTLYLLHGAYGNYTDSYDEDEGAHEWDFWDRHLKSFLAWLPLEDPMEGFSSGNVR